MLRLSVRGIRLATLANAQMSHFAPPLLPPLFFRGTKYNAFAFFYFSHLLHKIYLSDIILDTCLDFRIIGV